MRDQLYGKGSDDSEQTFEMINDEIFCIKYDSNSDMIFESWLQYFDDICSKGNFDDNWKLNNLGRFLKGDIISTYVNNYVNCETYGKLINILKEKYIRIFVTDLKTFVDMKAEWWQFIVNYRVVNNIMITFKIYFSIY